MTRIWAAGRFRDGARFIKPFDDRAAARAWIAEKQLAARLFTIYINTNMRLRDRMSLDRPAPKMHTHIAS